MSRKLTIQDGNIDINPVNGQVILYYQGVPVVQTAASGSGALEIDIGAGFEKVAPQSAIPTGTPDNGTTTDSTLRWNGTFWAEQLRITSSATGVLSVLDSTYTNGGAFSHDGTNFSTVFTGTTNWNITGAGLSVGGGTAITDTGNVPRLNAANTFTANQTISGGTLFVYDTNSYIKRNGSAFEMYAGSAYEVDLLCDTIKFKNSAASSLFGEFSSSGLAWGSGSVISSSDNVALLDAANIFSASQEIQDTSPRLILDQTGATADNARWDLLVSAETMYGRIYNDAATSYANWLTITRTGAIVDTITLDASTNIVLTGDVTASTLSVGGGSAITNTNNIALLNAANSFTSAGNTFTSTGGTSTTSGIAIAGTTFGGLHMANSSAAVDEKNWLIATNGSQFQIGARNDADSTLNNAITITRSADAPQTVTLGGTAAVADGTLAWGGGSAITSSNSVALLAGATFTGNLTVQEGTSGDYLNAYNTAGSYAGYRITNGATQAWAFRGSTTGVSLTDVTAGLDRFTIDTGGNGLLTGNFTSGNDGTNGYVGLEKGSATYSGYIKFFDATGTGLGYIGYGSAASVWNFAAYTGGFNSMSFAPDGVSAMTYASGGLSWGGGSAIASSNDVVSTSANLTFTGSDTFSQPLLIDAVSVVGVGGSSLNINSTNAQFTMGYTGGATNQKYWNWINNSGNLILRTMDDTMASPVNVLEFDRSGTTPTVISVTSNYVTSAGGIRITGTGGTYGASGAGLELEYNTSNGFVTSYDRSASSYMPLKIRGSVIDLEANSGTLTANGSTIWTAANDGSGSGLDADTLHSRGPALNPGSASSWIPIQEGDVSGALTSGTWYTVFTHPTTLDVTAAPPGSGGERYAGTLEVLDTTSGRHTNMKLEITWNYGSHGTVRFLNTSYGTPSFLLRLVHYSTYDGFAVQIQPTATTGAIYARLYNEHQSGTGALRGFTAQTPNGTWTLSDIDPNVYAEGTWTQDGGITGRAYGSAVNYPVPGTTVGQIEQFSGQYGSIQISGAHTAYHGISIGGRHVFMDNGSTTSGLYNDTNNQWILEGTDNGSAYLYYAGSSRIQTTSAGMSVTGAITASSNVTAYSDARLKSNIEPIPNALEKVLALSGYTFDKKVVVKESDGEGPDAPRKTVLKDADHRFVGVIAQEVRKVLPEVVTEGEDGYLSVAYGDMVGLLIEAIKDLKAEIDELKSDKYKDEENTR